MSSTGYHKKGINASQKASLKLKCVSFLLGLEHSEIGSLATVLMFLPHTSSQNTVYNLTKKRIIFLQPYIKILLFYFLHLRKKSLKTGIKLFYHYKAVSKLSNFKKWHATILKHKRKYSKENTHL